MKKFEAKLTNNQLQYLRQCKYTSLLFIISYDDRFDLVYAINSFPMIHELQALAKEMNEDTIYFLIDLDVR